MEHVNRSIETIESEAEEILESARSKANEILTAAKENAKRISFSKLNMDVVKAESVSSIQNAREEANKKVEISRRESTKFEARASEKIDGVVERILNLVTGVSS